MNFYGQAGGHSIAFAHSNLTSGKHEFKLFDPNWGEATFAHQGAGHYFTQFTNWWSGYNVNAQLRDDRFVQRYSG